MIKVHACGKDFWLHPTLKVNLDTIIYNTNQDWSHMIIISGSGKTRIGKSMLAQQIAAYVSDGLNRKFTLDCVVFDGDDLIKQGLKMPPSVFVHDESRHDLNAKHALRETGQKLIDFFAETGMLNHIVILVLTDFFELTKGLAVGQSECMINCFVKRTVSHDRTRDVAVSKKERGYFGYWGDTRKRLLYIKGKKQFDNYDAVSWDFWGNFEYGWILDEAAYTAKKLEFIKRNRDQVGGGNKYKEQRNILVGEVVKAGFEQKVVSSWLEQGGFPLTRQAVSAIVLKTKNKKQLD